MFDDERARVPQDRRGPVSRHNSLTVLLPVPDDDAEPCRMELQRQRAALERGWAEIPGLISACLAVLPAAPGTRPALLLECSFETSFTELSHACFVRLGPELSAVFGHCEGYPKSADARAFADYLGSRAQRSFAFAASVSQSELGRRFWRWLDAIGPAHLRSAVVADEPMLEARRSAIGMQEPVPGVPLVHVTTLRRGSRARLMRALRDLPFVPAPVVHDARFLLDGPRLVFVAYPSENAARWSERLSRVALDAGTRIWRNCQEFSGLLAVRRARRERRLAQFVLEHRIPVAAWFNARAPLRREGREG